MPPIPQNVRLLVKKNEDHARAERHYQDLQRGASVSQWHERALLKGSAAAGTTDRLALQAEQEQQVRSAPAVVTGVVDNRCMCSNRHC
jgi:hypothetical protein